MRDSCLFALIIALWIHRDQHIDQTVLLYQYKHEQINVTDLVVLSLN